MCLGRTRPGGQARRDSRRRRGAQKWADVAEQIKDGHPRERSKDGILRQHYETDSLDASTLLAALFGFLPPDDEPPEGERASRLQDDLTEDGFVLRYKTDETDDGLSGKEGTFLICSFCSFPRWRSWESSSVHGI
jgi:GH15 family glucan-1,4-alpha-glucosidase